MSDFMADLIKSIKEDPSKVQAKAVKSSVETTVESTKFVDGEKVKEVQPVTEEKKEVETKFVREKTLYLSVDMGATINLGNFNMGKVNVSLSMPVGTEITPELLAKIDSSYSFAKKFCETRMEQEVKELMRLRSV